MSDFIFLDDKQIKKCRINTFDDGNQRLEFNYDNIWNIIATNNKGKVKLQNNIDKTFVLESISLWKVKIINEEDDDLYLIYKNKDKK